MMELISFLQKGQNVDCDVVLKGVQSPEAKPREIVPLSKLGGLCENTNPKQEPGSKYFITYFKINLRRLDTLSL